MAGKAMLPMGIENFEDIRNEDFYYVDKTGLIRDLLENRSYVTLFTRPRRFGKTLNMSMLKYFFEPGSDHTLFDGLAISTETELCSRYQGKFPVISISLKNAEGSTIEKNKEKIQVSHRQRGGQVFLPFRQRQTERNRTPAVCETD